MDIHYCRVCGRKLTEEDFHTKNAIMTPEKRVMCMQCYTKSSSSVPESAPLELPQRSAERNAEPFQPSPMLIYGVFIGVLVLLGLGVLIWTMKPKPRVTESTPLIAPDVAPVPTPAPVPVKTLTPAELDKQAEDALGTALTVEPANRGKVLEDFVNRFPDSRFSGRARDELRKWKLQQEANTKGLIVLASLQPGAESWQFINGDEFGPSTGSFDRTGDGSAQNPYILTLKGDFTKGGGYVSALVKFNSGVNDVLAKIDFSRVAKMRFKARSKEAKGVTMRLSDSTGQALLYRMGLTPNGEWQTFEFKKMEGMMEHWGGANDGKLHWPVTSFTILLERGSLISSTLTQGTLQITQIELVLNEAPK